MADLAHERSGDTTVAPLTDSATSIAAGLRRATISAGAISAVLCLLDVLAIALGFWFAGFASPGWAETPWALTWIASLLAVGVGVVAWTLGLYEFPAVRQPLGGAAVLFGIAAPIGVIAGFEPIATLLIGAFILPARGFGAFLGGLTIDFGVTERRAVIVGGGDRSARVIAELARAGTGIRVCGVFDDRNDMRSPPVVRGVPKLGTLADMIAFVRVAEIDVLIITLPLTAERRIREIMKAVEVLPVDVRLSDFAEDQSYRRRTGTKEEAGGLISVMSRPLHARQRIAKRLLDIVGGSIALILLAPIFLVTAIAIRMESRGPVFFRQIRHGYNNRPVEVWKFRSMYADRSDPTARQLVTKNDPRVTRVGRFIRRWSIDELPQLFNVINGSLSLVGPRPHVMNAVSSQQQAFEAIVDGYAARHKVRPGVTGWAQIHGWRGEIKDPDALKRRVEYDLYYIENWSFWLDMKILLLTPFKLADSRGAY